MAIILAIEVIMPAIPRTYSRATMDALKLLGAQIRLARKQRLMSETDLAARIGISRGTMQSIEKGSAKVEIGLAFEAAVLVGVPLFLPDSAGIAAVIERVEDKLALLPQSVRRPLSGVKDDF